MRTMSAIQNIINNNSQHQHLNDTATGHNVDADPMTSVATTAMGSPAISNSHCSSPSPSLQSTTTTNVALLHDQQTTNDQNSTQNSFHMNELSS